MGMIPTRPEEMILCVDSDFDYLFAGRTEPVPASCRRPVHVPYLRLRHRELPLLRPSLHNVCVKATKNDTRIFDFVKFLHEYSRIIYPLFLWYAFSAQLASENVFPLIDFQSLGAPGLPRNREQRRTTIWSGCRRNVSKREKLLRRRNPRMIEPMKEFEAQLQQRGVKPENTYLFMHGHTLMDNVVMVLLNTVCESSRHVHRQDHRLAEAGRGAQEREMSNYTNSLRSIRDVLLDNEKLHQKPALQTVGTRHRAVHCPHDPEHEASTAQSRRRSIIGIIHRLRQPCDGAAIHTSGTAIEGSASNPSRRTRESPKNPDFRTGGDQYSPSCGRRAPWIAWPAE